MDTQKIKVDELKLSDIINEFSKGTIRIPRFQRNYVWDKPRVVKLLNSIYREYPIGTFFFWEASSEYIHLYRNIPELNIPEPDERSAFKFILDGQQRLTSLFVAINGLVLNIQDKYLNSKSIDYSEISFDLDKEEFAIKKPDSERFISLSTMLQKDHMELYDTLSRERRQSFNKCYQIFSTYPLSVVYVRDQDLAEACEIFERINQGGVKLSLFDLVVASTWSNEFDLKEKVNELNEQLDQKGFGVVNPENILQTLSLYIKGPATKVAQLQLKKDEIITAWPIISESIKLAVDHLKNNLGVKIIDFIPYPAMISMIAYLFAKKNNKSLSGEEKKFVEAWFWKSAFAQRYTASTQTLMGEDRRDLFDVLLAGKNPSINYPITLTQDDIINTRLYRYSSIRNGILCLMAQNNPLHFINGSIINLDRTSLSDFHSPERHHIFPRAYLKRTIKTYNENSIANFAFIPSELNRRISDTNPDIYFKEFLSGNKDAGSVLKSHFISEKAYKSIEQINFEEFIKYRSEILLSEIEKRTGKISPIEAQIHDNPNAVIDVLEERLRVVINMNLEERFGENYWKEAIPGDIQDAVKNKVKENTERYPDQIAVSCAEKLAFLNFGEYKTIIMKYWGLFEDEFVSRGDFERNFIYLNDYRNAVKHNRTLTSIEQKQGEAAAEWFANLLDPFFSENTQRQIDIIQKSEGKETYYLSTADGLVKASGKNLDDNEFLVLAGSLGKADIAPSFEKHCFSGYKLRKELLDKGIIFLNGENQVELKHDYLFSSPSMAGDVFLGRACNGWTEWKDEKGKTLDQKERNN